MSAHHTCSACHASVVPVAPGGAAKLAFAAAFLSLFALLVLVPMLGFVLFTVSPIVMLAGLGLAPFVDAAFAPPTCPKCHRRFVRAEGEGHAATHHAATARPASART